MGEFRSNEAASTWAREKGLRIVGTLWKGNGRPLNVYCQSWAPKEDNIEHEVWLTEFFMLYPEAEIRRGPNVSDKREDGMMILGTTYSVELFTGTQSRLQWLERLRAYKKANWTGPILTVVPPGKRDAAKIIQRLVEWTDLQNVYFAALEWLNGRRFDKVWRDGKGGWKAIVNPSETVSEELP